VDLPDDAQKLQDALFFREIEYIVRVPKGFAQGFLKGEAVQLEKTAVPASVSEIFLDNLINKYVNTAKAYISNLEGLSEKQLAGYIENDLAQKAEVELRNTAKEVSRSKKVSYYYSYMAYSLFAVLILGVSAVMIVFNNKNLKNRNQCSPMKQRNMNFQLILGNLSYAVLAWFVMILTSYFMYGGYMFTAKGLLFSLNSLVFTFAALSISFLIGNIVKGPAAVSAASNVVSLGSCFISGVFVPQELLGKTVLRIASFTPNYWYVKSNNIIANMAGLDGKSFAPVFYNMLIVLGFAIASLAVTLAVMKQMRVSR
jgi:ABC-2 type transport system permease protein